MIANEQLFSVIEQHIALAKKATTNAEMREELAAVKALCDVLLLNKSETVGSVQSFSSPIPPTPVVQNIVQGQTEEDGANGASIFDF